MGPSVLRLYCSDACCCGGEGEGCMGAFRMRPCTCASSPAVHKVSYINTHAVCHVYGEGRASFPERTLYGKQHSTTTSAVPFLGLLFFFAIGLPQVDGCNLQFARQVVAEIVLPPSTPGAGAGAGGAAQLAASGQPAAGSGAQQPPVRVALGTTVLSIWDGPGASSPGMPQAQVAVPQLLALGQRAMRRTPSARSFGAGHSTQQQGVGLDAAAVGRRGVPPRVALMMQQVRACVALPKESTTWFK